MSEQTLEEPRDTTINGVELRLTCEACPEQYDVFDLHGAQIGYLRLRHGQFTADYPDCNGKTVYSSLTKGDGQFFDANERISELTKAVNELITHHLIIVHGYLEKNDSTAYKRIHNLALDAGLLNYIDNETPPRYFIDGHADLEQVQRFAELIVWECADVLDFEDHKHCANLIKEHFRVEE
jgi:hypothetical protein